MINDLAILNCGLISLIVDVIAFPVILSNDLLLDTISSLLIENLLFLFVLMSWSLINHLCVEWLFIKIYLISIKLLKQRLSRALITCVIVTSWLWCLLWVCDKINYIALILQIVLRISSSLALLLTNRWFSWEFIANLIMRSLFGWSLGAGKSHSTHCSSVDLIINLLRILGFILSGRVYLLLNG